MYMKTRKNKNYIGLFGGYYVMDKQTKRVLLFFFIKNPSNNTYGGVMLDNFVDYPRTYSLSELKKELVKFKKQGPHYNCVCYTPNQLADIFKKHGASKFYSEKWFQKNYNFCLQQLTIVYPLQTHNTSIQDEIKKICID
jgi:hypothetical protein